MWHSDFSSDRHVCQKVLVDKRYTSLKSLLVPFFVFGVINKLYAIKLFY